MAQVGKTAGVVFVADDLAAWLVGLLADVGRRRLTRLVLGSDQERALRQAATVAIESTAAGLVPSGGGRAGELAMVVSEVFREPLAGAALAGQATLLEALQAGVAERLAVLDDAAVTGTGQSSAEVLGVPAEVLAEKLTGHLVREIMVRGSGGGPLAPLADQLNHDVTHLQGQRLEGMLAQLAGLVMTLAAAGTATVTSQPVRLLPRPPFLAGREELLAGLDARLTGAGADGPRLVALCGLGGAGKTSLALEYAYRHLAEVGVAWQFACEDAAVLAAGFGELAAQLGTGGLRDTRDPVASVHGVLAAYPQEWLLVFDNAPDRASVEAFLPPAGRGRVLITSRSALWPPRQLLDVPVLDTEARCRFFGQPHRRPRRAGLRRAGRGDGRAAAGAGAGRRLRPGYRRYLGRLSGRVPAAASGFAGAGRADRVWRDGGGGLGAGVHPGGGVGARCRGGVAAAGLLRPRSGPAGPAAASTARASRPASPEVMPVLAPLLGDALTVKDAVAALRQYSLVRPAGAGAVSAHRLVQAVTADQMPDQLRDAWRRATATVIEAAIPGGTRQPATWPACAVLLPHARVVLDLTSDGMERIATYLGSSGSYSAARDLFQLISDARREDNAYGPEHRDTLTARGRHAYWTGEAGDRAGARDQFAALLPIEERVLGPEHPDTLSARSNLARWTGEAGDAAGARDRFAVLLPVRERVSGPEHPDTLATRGHLAYWTGEAGDAAGARDQFAALLPVRERISGAEHPDILVARANLAYWTGRAGDPASARDLFAALLPVSELVLGAEHPSTLATHAYLARWTGEAGDPAAARDLFAALLPVRERISGPEHPDTLVARANLARWTGDAGDPAAARDLFAALLPVRERVSGPEHPDTLTVRAYLARWTGEAGDPAAARDQFAALLPVRERISGPEHPNTLTVRTNLATWTRQANHPHR